MAPAYGQERLNDLIGRSIRRQVQLTRALRQFPGSLMQIPVDPLIPRLTAYPLQMTKLSDRQCLAQIIRNEPHALVHRRYLTPRHGHLPYSVPASVTNCYLLSLD